MDNDEIILPMLSSFDITLREYNVLEAIRVCGGQVARGRLARYTQKMIDIYRDLASEEYEETIADCIRKQWIKILTTEDCVRDRERWTDTDAENQYISECTYIEGNMDFTPTGATLWDAVETRIEPTFGRRPHEGVGYAWRFPQQIRFLGAYKEEVIQAAEEAKAQPNLMWVSDEDTLHIDRIEAPLEIGPWWFSRFVRLPKGYRIDAFYTLLPN